VTTHERLVGVVLREALHMDAGFRNAYSAYRAAQARGLEHSDAARVAYDRERARVLNDVATALRLESATPTSPAAPLPPMPITARA
jgi:hypothetical protein